MLIATGASTMSEIKKLLKRLLKINSKIILMQCNTNYTGDDNNLDFINLNVLKNLGPKGRLAAAAITGLALGAKPIANKLKEIGKKRRDAAIDKQVDKYVADRKGPIRKVNYMPDNMYTVKRDKDGKVTGTGDQIRVVPGTRTIKRMPKPGERTSIKSRFSQNTRMKLGNYGSLSPMDEATMTPAQKRKDTMLKKKYEKSDDMMDSFKDQYGKKKGKEVFYAFIRKKSMEEENIQEILDKKDVPHIKKLIKKLKDGSELHAKQSKDLEVALKTENTAIESELVIQDWNKDDIKFTEIETVDIIKAMMPGGSVIGCPKINTLNLLNNQEKENRNIYTGSFGYIKFNGDMRFNIIIRSILNYKNISEISVASGVVVDSNANHEFNENFLKAKALIDLFK